MAITNLNNVHLSEAEVNAAKDALAGLENALSIINVTLTSEDRQRYGSIHEQNKLFVNKVNDYYESEPQLATNQVDWVEFSKDHKSRLLLEGLIMRIESLGVKLRNAKILHDYDSYQSALTDYAFTNFMAGAGAPGYETKMNELKQFFTKTSPQAPPTNQQ